MNSDLSFYGVRMTGRYADFTLGWFEDVGMTLVCVLLFTGVWPIVEFTWSFVWRGIVKIID